MPCSLSPPFFCRTRAFRSPHYPYRIEWLDKEARLAGNAALQANIPYIGKDFTMKALLQTLAAAALMLLASASFAGTRALCDLVDEPALKALSLEGAKSRSIETQARTVAGRDQRIGSCEYRKYGHEEPVLTASLFGRVRRGAVFVNCGDLLDLSDETTFISCTQVFADRTVAVWTLVQRIADNPLSTEAVKSIFEDLARRRSEEDSSAAVGKSGKNSTKARTGSTLPAAS